MNEILPGILHWTTFHEGIGQRVSSYYVSEAAALIDPRVPDEGLSALERRPPQRILLTNRHHYRHSDRFEQAFGCTVHCHEAGLHEFDDGRAVHGFRFGDEVAPGITALEVGALTPEETALHIGPVGGAVAIGDGLIRGSDGSLAFVSDSLMGDPEADKRGLRESLGALLEHEFDGLLFAHGEPLAKGGRSELAGFLGRDSE